MPASQVATEQVGQVRYEIDLTAESVLTIAEAAITMAKLQGRKKPLCKNQVRRYTRNGIRGVTLPSVLVAGFRVTTREALHWWIKAVTAAHAAGVHHRGATVRSSVVAPTTPAQARTLKRAGITEIHS